MARYLFDKTTINWSIGLIAFLTFFNGILAMSSELIFHTVSYPYYFQAFVPFGLYHASRTLTLVFGFALVYLSYNIYRRKLIAWWVVVAILTYISMIHLLHFRLSYLLLAPLITLFFLVCCRKYFIVRYDKYNILQGIGVAVLILFFAIIFGALGFWFLDQKEFGIDFHMGESLVRTLREYFLIGNNDLVPKSRYAVRFLELLRFLGLTAFTFAAYNIFKPLYRLKTQAYEHDLASKLTDIYGNSSLDFFKLWPNKYYFFGAENQGYIAFRISKGVALALGDPVAKDDHKEDILHGFVEHCKQHGWIAAFYCVTDQFMQISKKHRFEALRIGQEAIVDLKIFQERTSQDKDIARVRRKLVNNGFSFAVYDPPCQEKLVEKLRAISDDWLKISGRRERNFAVGYFDDKYIASSRIFVVKNKANEIVALANEIPSHSKGEATIDLMRYGKDAPNGTMDFLFIELFYYFLDRGFKRFDLGLSPISGAEHCPDDSFKEKALYELYKNATILFSFKGLHNYKKKFEPLWEDRYLVYLGGPIALVRTAMSLTSLTRAKNNFYE